MNKHKFCVIQPLIGGMALAAEEAFGQSPEFVIDYQGIANSELYLNYQKEKRNKSIPHFIFNGNFISKVQDFETEEMKNEFDKLNKNIDVVVAVPVCSGLSGANSTGKEEHRAGSEAVQNNNQLGILEFVISKIKPKVYIYENAPGLYTNMGTGLREKIVSVAKAAGYNIQFNKVNTINYGLPQSRQRTFCILWRKDVFATVPKFPFERLPRQTLLEFFKTSPDEPNEAQLREEFEKRPFINYLKAHYGNRDSWLEEFFKDEDNTFELLEKYDEYDMALDVCTKINPKISKYIDHIKKKLAMGKGFFTDDNYGKNPDHCGAIYWKQFMQLINPIKRRFLGANEAMKLMGMPDDFDVPSNLAMIGQNVPKNTAYAMCKDIALAFEGKLTYTSDEVSMQDLTKESHFTNKKINNFIK